MTLRSSVLFNETAIRLSLSGWQVRTMNHSFLEI